MLPILYLVFGPLLLGYLPAGYRSVPALNAPTVRGHMNAQLLQLRYSDSAIRRGEIWTLQQEEAAGIVRKYSLQPWDTNISIPGAFDWRNNDGVNYLTIMRNQNVPQYCGCCWAFNVISSLADRIKIIRKAQGPDINLSPQHLLNCGNVGNCYSGTMVGVLTWIENMGRAGAGISYETSNPYMACSKNSTWGLCPLQTWNCTPMNTARTCEGFPSTGGKCAAVYPYPNATISKWGIITGFDFVGMQLEIMNGGPIACTTEAQILNTYKGGIITTIGTEMSHIISLVGWGNESGLQYWIGRNSWGEYWGEMGFFRAAFGAAFIGHECIWAVPGRFTPLTVL